MAGDAEGRRRTRWFGLVSLAITRLWHRTTRTRSGRAAATLTAVALTVALLVTVTGVALALAAGGAAGDDDADVRVLPAESGSLSAVDGVERPRLGGTNENAAAMRSAADVDHASPVLAEPGRLEGADGESHIVLFVGVVPDDEPRTVGGLPTSGLEPGDPHYADGTYEGAPTGEVVLSRAAADRLDANEEDELDVPATDSAVDVPSASMTVTAVEDRENDRDTDVPVALVHLSELQSFAGADDGQLADRVILWGDRDAATAVASDRYPDAAVESGGVADPSALFDDGLALAASALALIVGVVICASFVATTAGMTVDDDRRTLAVLESVGVARRGRLAVVAVSTLTTTLCGALVGAGLGLAGIHLTNEIAAATVAPGAVAVAHPLFVPYAVAVALVSGLIAVPYPLAMAARTSVLEEVNR